MSWNYNTIKYFFRSEAFFGANFLNWFSRFVWDFATLLWKILFRKTLQFEEILHWAIHWIHHLQSNMIEMMSLFWNENMHYLFMHAKHSTTYTQVNMYFENVYRKQTNCQTYKSLSFWHVDTHMCVLDLCSFRFCVKIAEGDSFQLHPWISYSRAFHDLSGCHDDELIGFSFYGTLSFESICFCFRIYHRVLNYCSLNFLPIFICLLN